MHNTLVFFNIKLRFDTDRVIKSGTTDLVLTFKLIFPIIDMTIHKTVYHQY